MGHCRKYLALDAGQSAPGLRPIRQHPYRPSLQSSISAIALDACQLRLQAPSRRLPLRTTKNPRSTFCLLQVRDSSLGVPTANQTLRSAFAYSPEKRIFLSLLFTLAPCIITRCASIPLLTNTTANCDKICRVVDVVLPTKDAMLHKIPIA